MSEVITGSTRKAAVWGVIACSSASCVGGTALTDAALFVLSREDFEKFYKTIPQLRLNFDLAIKSRQLARKLQFKWLRPDEVIYFLARKHRIILYESLLLPTFGLLLPVALLYVWWFVIPWAIIALAALLSFLGILSLIGWRIVDWGNDYYVVTNQRVVYLEKVVGVYDSRQESPLSTILSVGVEANQIGKILDYGNVIIRTFVGKIVFANVDHPNHAGKMVEEYWNRTKEFAAVIEKEALKNAIRLLSTRELTAPQMMLTKMTLTKPRSICRRAKRVSGANQAVMEVRRSSSHWAGTSCQG